MVSEPTLISDSLRAYIHTLSANLERSDRRGLTDEEFIRQTSPVELKLMEAFLRIGVEPLQQFPIAQYDADFYFPHVKLCVEVDGWVAHHGRGLRDRLRDEALAKKGIYTYRIPARYVAADADACARAVRALVDRMEIQQMKDA